MQIICPISYWKFYDSRAHSIIIKCQPSTTQPHWSLKCKLVQGKHHFYIWINPILWLCFKVNLAFFLTLESSSMLTLMRRIHPLLVLCVSDNLQKILTRRLSRLAKSHENLADVHTQPVIKLNFCSGVFCGWISDSHRQLLKKNALRSKISLRSANI